MRIRKRKVPLPLSLLSPVPLSDPHLFSRSPVILVQGVATSSTLGNTHNSFGQLPPSLSDHLTTPTTCSDNTTPSDLRRGVIVESTTIDDASTGFGDVVEGIQTSNDDVSNASLTTTSVADENNNGRLLLSLSKYEDQVGRWCDGDKAIPLKKRRGIGFNSVVESSSTITDDEEGDPTTTPTTMIMMKWKNNDEEDREEKQRESVVLVADDTSKKDIGVNNNGVLVVASAKKGNSKRGNTIMEGSRCSRVNGRGWRCCQPTLVGYSLCEHHLGKGRLRSMTSSGGGGGGAKSRSSAKKKNNNNSTNTTTKFALGQDDERETMDNGSEKKLERMSSFGNKRVKLGVVKARSLSSLLGQTNTMNNIVADHANMQQYEKVSNLDHH